MVSCGRIWQLWVLLLALFAEQPLGHCAETCRVADHTVALPVAEAPQAVGTHHHEGCQGHLPCIHQSSGEVQLPGSVCKKFCALPPPVEVCVPVAAGVVAARGRGLLRRPVPPLAGLCLPMLC